MLMFKTVSNTTSYYLALLLCFVIGLISLQASAAPSQAEDIRTKLMNPSSTEVLVVAHRAAWKNAPENSLLAIQHAIDMGVDIVEIDIQRTKEGEFILLHDKTLNRTTNAKGKVADYTWAELKGLRLRQGLGRVKVKGQTINTKLTNETIPHLRDALALSKGKVLVNLDKADKFMAEVFALVREMGVERQVILKGKKGYRAAVFDLKQGEQTFEGIYMPKYNFRAAKKKKRQGKNAKQKEQLISNKNTHKTAPFTLKDLNSSGSAKDWYAGIEDSPMAEMKFSSLAQPQIQPKVLKPLIQKHRFWVNTLKVSHSADFTDSRALHKPDSVWGELINMGYSVIQTDEPRALLNYLRKLERHD